MSQKPCKTAEKYSPLSENYGSKQCKDNHADTQQMTIGNLTIRQSGIKKNGKQLIEIKKDNKKKLLKL